MKDAKKTASCYLLKEGLGSFSRNERINTIQAALKHRVNTVLTSSMGRLFDAVASLLDLGHSNRYEGECAVNLEREAVFAIRENKKATKLSFAIRKENEIMVIEPGPLLKTICERSMSYGSGGIQTSNLIHDIFLKHFNNSILNKLEDSAVPCEALAMVRMQQSSVRLQKEKASP